MAVAFDVATSAGSLSNVSSASWSHTAGTPDYARVSFGVSRNGGGDAGATVTYGGAAMTSVGSSEGAMTDGSTGLAEIFEKIAPATGTQTVAITFNAGAYYGSAGAQTFTGVHQTTASGTPDTNSGATGLTSTCTVSCASGDMVSDAITIYASTSTPTASGDSRFAAAGFTGTNYWGAGQTEDGAASVDMTWDWVTHSFSFYHVAVPILQAGGGFIPYPRPRGEHAGMSSMGGGLN